MAPRKILIIDDDHDFYPLNEWFLRNNNIECDIEFASNGYDALNLINSTAVKPDLILLDMTMPIMDGMDFIEAYGDTQPNSRAKVFVLSNFYSEARTKAILSYKFVSDILSKPLSDASVKKILGHYMLS